MLKKLKTNNRGFTIIEVMIVLAVAAMIILIVLLAVPALQRSSRNTTIKSDASSVAAAISTWETNNAGALPGTITGTGDITIAGSSATVNPDTVKIQGTTTASLVTALPTIGASATLQPNAIQVWSGHKCSTTPGDTTAANYTANTRSMAVFYVTETSSATQLQCIDA